MPATVHSQPSRTDIFVCTLKKTELPSISEDIEVNVDILSSLPSYPLSRNFSSSSLKYFLSATELIGLTNLVNKFSTVQASFFNICLSSRRVKMCRGSSWRCNEVIKKQLCPVEQILIQNTCCRFAASRYFNFVKSQQ